MNALLPPAAAIADGNRRTFYPREQTLTFPIPEARLQDLKYAKPS
jgi:hypothetical protein